MNAYVESNFFLELVLEQEQSSSCEALIESCDAATLRLIIPAYSMVEPYEKLVRQSSRRRELRRNLENEIQELARTASYTTRLADVEDLTLLLVSSNADERRRFAQVRETLLQKAEIIPLTPEILVAAATYETILELSVQDAIIYASIVSHLTQEQPDIACFINRNSHDFRTPEIVATLSGYNCRLITRFDDGLGFIRSQS